MPTTNSVNNEFLNNVTVSTSAAGATSSATIQNLDNTNTASHAELSLTTGGANSGDSYINFTNNVVDWSIGIDNSDSDSFVVSKSSSAGTTNTARCDSTGRWNYPLQSAFNAHKDATALNVTGTGTVYTPIMNVAKFNQGSDYSTVSGQFTAPVTGKYVLTTCCYMGGGTVMTSILNNLYTSNKLYIFYTTKPSSNNSSSAGGLAIVDMDAGDVAYQYVQTYGDASDVVDYDAGLISRNHLSGALIQ